MRRVPNSEIVFNETPASSRSGPWPLATVSSESLGTHSEPRSNSMPA